MLKRGASDSFSAEMFTNTGERKRKAWNVEGYYEVAHSNATRWESLEFQVTRPRPLLVGIFVFGIVLIIKRWR